MPLTQVSSRVIEDTLRYVLGASGTNHYTFTGKGLTGAVNDPTLTLSRGHTYIFENRSGGHPFYIKTSIANGGTSDAYNTGVTNNGGGNGSEIIFTVPHDAPDLLYYQCSSHSSMNGQLKIAGAVADGSITESKLADDAVTEDKLANSINSAIAANTAKDLTALSASNLTSGTVPDARFPATLPAVSGANLTNLPASGVSVSGNANNRIITGDGTNLVAENFFQYNDSTGQVELTAPEGTDVEFRMNADENDDMYDRWKHVVDASGNHYRLYQMNAGGGWGEKLKIHSDRGNIEPTHDPMGLYGAGICVAIAQSNQGNQSDSPNFKVDFTVPMGRMATTKVNDIDYGTSSGQTRHNASPKAFGGSGILIASCHGNYYWGYQTKIYHISTTGNSSNFVTHLNQLHSYSHAGHGSNNSSISLSVHSNSSFTPTIRATFGGDYWSANCLQVTYIGSGAASYANLGGLTHLDSALTGQDSSWK